MVVGVGSGVDEGYVLEGHGDIHGVVHKGFPLEVELGAGEDAKATIVRNYCIPVFLQV